jgi:uncharacterized repeat protein (TIGR01451 family)
MGLRSGQMLERHTYSRGKAHLFKLLAVLLFSFAALWAMPASAQTTATCAPATSQGTAPPSWQTYCWLDFSGYVEATSRSAAGQNFSVTLSDGAVLSFNLRTTGTPTVVSRAAPSWTGAAVGNTAFLGIPNRPILYQQAGGTTTLTISSILITPPPGSPAVTAYMFVGADAESTNNGESLSFNTNGGGWTILDQVNPITGSLYPTISGAGTATFTETGVAGTVGGYIVGSTSPTTVTTTLVGGGLQGAMFAVRFASMRLNKQIIGARVNPADQFKFDIRATSTSSVLGTGTSTGTGNGPFTAAAVSLASGVPLTLTESMATGSVSALSQYSSRLTCINGTSGSSTPLPTNLATTNYNFGALQFGDAIQCTFTNTAFPHLRLQKALGATGRLFNTDQFVMNINQGATNIATTTTTGTGTTVTNGATAMTQVTAGTAYSMNELASGTTTLAQYTAAMACTNAWASSTTVLPTAIPGNVTPQLGDVITCTITNTRRSNNATLSATKISMVISDGVSGANPKALPNAVVRYTIGVANTGTLAVDNNTVFVLDQLPPNITYNASSTPVFTQGPVSSGLSFTAGSDIRFAGAGTPPANFAACTLSAGSGYNPAIRYVCIRPQGSMAGATAAGQPSFSIAFDTRVE